MVNRQIVPTNATASGAADVPALADNRGQGAGEKFATGQRTNWKQKHKLITPKLEVQLATWNVRTGYHVGQLEIIARELSRYKISITALSELRLTESGTKTIRIPGNGDEMTFFYSGGHKHIEGVGFAVDHRAMKSIIAFQAA